MVKWTNAGGQTKPANERSFVYHPPAWRRWRNVKTTNNNSERFFKFMPLVSVSFHQSCPGFDGMRSIDNASREVLFEQRIFPLIFISTIRQMFCLSPLLLMRIWCEIVPLWKPFEHPNSSFRLQADSPIEVTSKISTSIIPYSDVK